MPGFERQLQGYPQLDQVPVNRQLQDFDRDGFKVYRSPIPWANYLQLKSILHHVLGERTFEVLFRDGVTIERAAFHLAGTIVMHYVGRYSDRADLQTTLIAQIVSMRANMTVGQRAATLTQIERMLTQCQLPADYVKYIQQKISEAKVLETPWWAMINY